MENTLYYTFSTIPQVLAAMIALLGVFWVFKIKEIKKRLMYLAEVVKREINYRNTAKKHYVEKLHSSLIENFDYSRFDCRQLSDRISSSYEQDDYKWIYDTICVLEKAEKNPIITSMRKKFEDFDQEKNELTRNSKNAIVLSGCQIGISVLVLMLVDVIIEYCCLPYWVMGTSLVLFLFNVFLMVYAIWVSLKVEKYVVK